VDCEHGSGQPSTYVLTDGCLASCAGSAWRVCLSGLQVAAALEEAVSVRKGVEQQFKSAQQAVREAEAAYKQKVGAR
jgi:hypothetical protein